MAQTPTLNPQAKDHVILLGGTFAERMQHYGYLEALLQVNHPGKEITVRNMGWSGDEVGLMPRPFDFGELEGHLHHAEADVILLCFGMSESFQGEAGLSAFITGYEAFIDRLSKQPFHGEAKARLALVSPIAHEALGGRYTDPAAHNRDLERYTAAIQKLAVQRQLPFFDLYAPTKDVKGITINGIHLNEKGYKLVSEVIAGRKFEDRFEPVRKLTVRKDEQFFLRWRPINGEYVYGRRKEPFGIISYPPEMMQLDQTIADLDRQIWSSARALTTTQP